MNLLDKLMTKIGEAMMGNEQPPQRCKTVREVELENLLAEALPIVVDVEMGVATSEKLRSLIARIEAELAK